MTVIYIRHGDDENTNKSYPNDPSLTRNASWSIKKLTWQLVKKYGRPDAIYVSPMRRTWETGLIIGESLNRRVPLITDYHLSRYFTQKEKNPKTVRPDTLKRKVPILESKSQFKDRVDRHIDHFTPFYSKESPVIWCITHALVLKRVGKALDLDLKDHFDFLETLVVEKKNRV